MRIAIVGVGQVGEFYARQWSRAGHELVLTFVRDRAKVDRLVADLGGSASYAEPDRAVAGADVVLFAPRFEHIELAAGLVGELEGTVVLDANNPFTPARDGFEDLGPGTTAATLVRDLFPRARHVKAFHNVGIEMIRQDPGRRPVAMIASDDVEAAALASLLAVDAGLVPLVTGGLETAAWSEPPGPLFGKTYDLHAAAEALQAISTGQV